MLGKPSPRIIRAVDALPLRPGMQVLEIGCGPGVAARLVCQRIGAGSVTAIDRSEKAIALARAGSASEIAAGRLRLLCIAVEAFQLPPQAERFDLAFALRVGALDGRHPQLWPQAMSRLKAALKPDGLLCIDDTPPIRADAIAV